MHAIRWAGRSVKADEVAQKMLDLRQSASDDEGQPLTRASVMNLIVYAPGPEAAAAAIPIVDELATRHPSRAIVVAPRRGRTFGLDAEVVLNRHPLASHRLVFERALLRPRGAAPEGIDTLVIPLLIPHLQSVLWWLGDPDPGDPALRSLSQICDRLVVDTARGASELLSPLSALAGGAGGSRLVLGDMAWTRLDAFRDTTAGVFDEPRRAEYLEEVEVVEITGTRPARSAVSAGELLFAGWLSSRLGCSQPSRSARGVTFVVDASGRRCEVAFAGHPSRGASPPPLHGVRLTGRVGRSRHLELELVEERGEGRLTLREAGHQPVQRTVPLGFPSEAEVLSRELARMGRDRVFEDALLSAARIAAALRA